MTVVHGSLGANVITSTATNVSAVSLEGVLREVAEMQDKAAMTEEVRGRLRFEYTECVRNIQAWKAHLLRSSNQDKAKQHILQKLRELVSCHNGLGHEVSACAIQRTDE